MGGRNLLVEAEIVFGPQSFSQLADNPYIQHMAHHKRTHISAAPDVLRKIFDEALLSSVFGETLADAESAVRRRLPVESFSLRDQYPLQSSSALLVLDEEISVKRAIPGYPDTFIDLWATAPKALRHLQY